METPISSGKRPACLGIPSSCRTLKGSNAQIAVRLQKVRVTQLGSVRNSVVQDTLEFPPIKRTLNFLFLTSTYLSHIEQT